jgi:hypothetical protein
MPPAESHDIEITVDLKTVTTTVRELTPAQIMELVGIDPATHFLIEVEGREQKSLEGQNGVLLHLHEDMKFVSASTRPTPVS